MPPFLFKSLRSLRQASENTAKRVMSAMMPPCMSHHVMTLMPMILRAGRVHREVVALFLSSRGRRRRLDLPVDDAIIHRLVA